MTRDNENAKFMAAELAKLDCIDLDERVVETNILRFKFQPDYTKFKHSEFCQLLEEEHGILARWGHKDESIRIVTHRDVSKKQIKAAISTFKKILE